MRVRKPARKPVPKTEAYRATPEMTTSLEQEADNVFAYQGLFQIL